MDRTEELLNKDELTIEERDELKRLTCLGGYDIGEHEAPYVDHWDHEQRTK